MFRCQIKICLHVSLVLCPRSHKLMFWSFFTGAGGFDDAEQEVLRRDCPRSFGQEPQGIGRACAAARHQGDQPQRPRQVRGERVNCWPRPSPTMKPNSFFMSIPAEAEHNKSFSNVPISLLGSLYQVKLSWFRYCEWCGLSVDKFNMVLKLLLQKNR